LGYRSKFLIADLVKMMRDLLADWRKWSRLERISALVGALAVALLVPTLAATALFAN
jgi:hypothetical protein